MDYASTMSAPAYPKRPGSPIGTSSMPASKVPRVNTSQLQINYLVRQKQETLPLVSTEERMPRILELIGEYDGVLHRHESMAGNLGACPLGPILLKRFERLFEGPPRVLKSHAKDPSITWLDVVEFAQNRPEQFNLEKQRNGVRVCQFYHKQCRVEISEEDYVLIASGMPQKLIPPQPILEDEEKELGVMEILERNLGKLVQMADQISARARQLNHRLKGRRSAIMSRREAEVDPQKGVLQSNESPRSPMELVGAAGRPVKSIETSQSPPLGFTAVNVRQSLPQVLDGRKLGTDLDAVLTSANITMNGRSEDVPDDNISKFLTESERKAGMTEHTIRRNSAGLRTDVPVFNRDMFNRATIAKPRQETIDVGRAFTDAAKSAEASPSVAIPSTPSSLLPQSKPTSIPRDDGGPHKAEMVARMENMARGERIIPPCDRCRRLQMDCMKNLTACQGCTKKHAKCSWKDVTADELGAGASMASSQRPAGPTTTEQKSKSPVYNDPPSRDWNHLLKEKGSIDAMQVDRAVSDITEVPPPEVDPVQQPRTRSHSPVEPGSIAVSTAVVTPRQSSHQNQPTQQQLSPKLDLRPPPLEQQQQQRARDSPNLNGRFQGQSQNQIVHHHSSTIGTDHQAQSHAQFQPRGQTQTSRVEQRRSADTIDIGHDESDRLEELARQVYRSASASHGHVRSHSQGIRPGSR